MEKEPSARYWKIWYAIVLLLLVAQLVFFHWITFHF
jgi:hypothetical protein